jgi:hypothetical protein
MLPCRSFLTPDEPTRANVWPTARSASSTVQALTGFLREKNGPSLYRNPKTGGLGYDIPSSVGICPCRYEEKMVPPRPMFVLRFGALKINAVSYLFINKVEVIAEDIGFWIWQSVHGSVCGNWHLKWASKVLSDRSHYLVVTSSIRFTPPGMLNGPSALLRPQKTLSKLCNSARFTRCLLAAPPCTIPIKSST